MSILLWLAPIVKEMLFSLPFRLLHSPSCVKTRTRLGCSRQESQCFSCFHCSVMYIISRVCSTAKGINLVITTTVQLFFFCQAHLSYQIKDLRLKLSGKRKWKLTEKQMLQHYIFQLYTVLRTASCSRKTAYFYVTHWSSVQCHSITTSGFPPLSALFAIATSYAHLLTFSALWKQLLLREYASFSVCLQALHTS